MKTKNFITFTTVAILSTVAVSFTGVKLSNLDNNTTEANISDNSSETLVAGLRSQRRRTCSRCQVF